MTERFHSRTDAGRLLAQSLADYANQPDVAVVGLARGGVPVAFEVALQLHAPLDVIVVRKLCMPGCSEIALGAIASGGVRVMNEIVLFELDLPPRITEEITRQEIIELHRRELLYQGHSQNTNLQDKRVILIDDGIATGATMRAAVCSVRAHNPRQIVAASPVISQTIGTYLEREADRVVALRRPADFRSVAVWYHHFPETTDAEVIALLDKARSRSSLILITEKEHI